MALVVERPVDGPASRPAAVALDLRRGSQPFGDEPARVFGVVSCVGNDVANIPEVFEQTFRLGAVGPLAGGEFEPDRQAERINGGMDLGRQSAAGPTDCTSLKPPFCEVASAWTLQIVASISTYSKSGSRDKTLKRLQNTPASVQRRKRQCTVRQLPSSGGRSHQPEHRINEKPVVRPTSPPIPLLAGKKRLDPAPLTVRQGSSAQDRLRFRS